jgi:hypothetical protein
MERVYYYSGSFKIFSLLVALSFILASLITFVKYDFSQMGKKILTFSKFAILFLAASLVFSTIGIAKGDLFTGSKDFYPFSSLKYEGDVYTYAYQRGISRIIKYDSESDRMEKISGKSSHPRSRFSIGGENIIYPREARLPKKYWLNNIWVVNTDGTGEKALVEIDNPDSPVYNQEILGGGLLSSDGKEVIFLTYLFDKDVQKKVITAWWMNINGSVIKKKKLEFPRNCWSFQLLAWSEAENYLILMYEIKSQAFKPLAKRIVLVNLENESQRTICENVIEGIYKLRTSPTGDHLAFGSRGEPDGKERLIIFDLMTLEKKTIFEAELLKLWAVKWSQDGRKILFSRTNELWAYFLDENKLRKVSQRNYDYEIGFDWLADNERLVLLIPVDGEYQLSVLSEELKEVKRIKTPYPIEGPVFAWGLNNTVLLKFRMGPLFRLDLETEKWKKVY